MSWGKRLEPVITARWRELNPDAGVLVADGCTYSSPVRHWQHAAPDALILGDYVYPYATGANPVMVHGGLEAKYSLFGDGWGPSGTDEIPPYYRCQVVWCMDVFEVESWHVAVFIGGSAEFRTYLVRYDADEAGWLREQGLAFLTSLDGPPPEIDGSGATYAAVKALHPDIDPSESVVIPQALCDAYDAAQAGMKDAKRKLNRTGGLVLDLMGSAKYADRPDGTRLASRSARAGDESVPYLRPARKG